MGRTAAKTRALGWGAQTKKFNLVFEDFMRSLGGAVTEDAGNPSGSPYPPYYGKSLSVILEDIGRPEHIVSSSGERILLEDALGMGDWELIAEGFDLNAVKGAVSKVLRKVADAFRAVLRKSMGAVQKFIEKLRANKVVGKVIAKYGLDAKAKAVKSGISFSRRRKRAEDGHQPREDEGGVRGAGGVAWLSAGVSWFWLHRPALV